MAKTYPCDNGCGELADVNIHVISKTDITWVCPECFGASMVAYTRGLPDDVLLAAGLMKVTAPAAVTEGGSDGSPAERPPDPDGDEDEDEGADGAPEAREAGAEAGDPGGDGGVSAGAGAGAEPAPEPATP